MTVNQGDVYWIAIPAAGAEPGAAHPHVVIQDDAINHSRVDTVVVCAVTTNPKRAGEPGNVALEAGEANLPRRSFVVAAQVSSIRKDRLGAYIGTLSQERVEQILSGMRFIQRMSRQPETQTDSSGESPMSLPNPAFDYDHQEHHYDQIRRADPRIEQYVLRALAGCQTVLNVGAGTGSYEPQDRFTLAVEPSSVMRAKRLALGRPPAVDAGANHLPFDAHSFDAAMAVLTIHHWPDLAAGLLEMKRVARQKIILLTYDPDQLDVFWNAHYFPELIEIERRRYPPLERITEILGVTPTITTIRIPLDCTDGFQEAFYGRPEAFLNPQVRSAQSAWGFLDQGLERAYLQHLAGDLASGEWDRRYGVHRSLPEFEGAFRLLEFNLS